MGNKKLFSIILTVLLVSKVFSLSVPELTGPVVDEAGLLNTQQYDYLTQLLTNYDPESGAQIAVLTVDSLEGDSIEGFAYEVAKQWKIGSKENNNGVIIIVAFKERKIRIHTGYGVEESLTDAKSGLIIRNVMAPLFQSGKYGEGIVAGVENVAAITGYKGVEASDAINSENYGPDKAGIPILAVFMLIWIIMVTGGLSAKFPGVLGWLPWAILFKNASRGSSRYSSGSHDRWNSGFGGGSGFSGGGFSGGGGGFGGGGASGSW